MQKEFWSASKIDTANYCMMRYYLKYLDPLKTKPLKLSYYAKGKLLHELIEKFWSRLGTSEEVEKDKKSRKKAGENKKYYDAESFADYAKRCWTRIIIGNRENKNLSKKIYWRDGYENDSEGWEIRDKIQKISAPLFREFIKEGPPRLYYSEIPFDFEAEGLRFKGFIDEIRLKEGKIVIRDYKSGSPFGIREMKRDFDPQLTFYNAGLTSLFNTGDKIGRKLADDLGIENIDLMRGSYINPDIIEEFFMVEAPYIIELANRPSPTPPKKEEFTSIEDYIKSYGDFRENLAIWKEKKKKLSFLPQVIHQTKRTEEHFYHLVNNIKKAKKSIETDNISFEHGKKCDFCDMRHVCSKKACEPINIENKLTDKNNNLIFSFTSLPSQTSYQPTAQDQTINQNQLHTATITTKKQTQKEIDYRRKEPWRGKF